MTRDTKSQQLVMLQDAIDGAAASLSSRVDIVETQEILKCLFGLQIHTKDREDLTMGVSQFILGQQTIAV